MKQYEQTQQAVETVTRQYDQLREQGVSHAEALTFITLEHGILRSRLATIINEHLAGLHGQSGRTVIGSSTMSTPATEHKPAHGGYPGKVTSSMTFPEEWADE
jgi:hypothetical protein